MLKPFRSGRSDWAFFISLLIFYLSVPITIPAFIPLITVIHVLPVPGLDINLVPASVVISILDHVESLLDVDHWNQVRLKLLYFIQQPVVVDLVIPEAVGQCGIITLCPSSDPVDNRFEFQKVGQDTGCHVVVRNGTDKVSIPDLILRKLVFPGNSTDDHFGLKFLPESPDQLQ